jgi:hypothetical protein
MRGLLAVTALVSVGAQPPTKRRWGVGDFRCHQWFSMFFSYFVGYAILRQSGELAYLITPLRNWSLDRASDEDQVLA